MSSYHQGEIEVQDKAGVREEASRIGKIVREDIPDVAARFIEQQVMIILGARDGEGFVWCSVLYGEPGFVMTVDARTLFVSTLPPQTDPLYASIQPGHSIGLLAIEFASRKRMRVNGVITQLQEDGFLVTTSEVYANCPKYIQSRTFLGFKPMQKQEPRLSARLDQDQTDTIRRSDTLFIATHPTGSGADASHRGGQPGFIQVMDPHTLVIPDYKGNAMFNTLGNAALYPQTGLMFLDFESGDLLQLSGETTVSWEGSERAIRFSIREIRSVPGGFPLRWTFDSYSPFNPATR
ncbi:pyridoxamine 5'-phosphate oxidase family protein [Paenibacillus sp. 1P07SE]|uniref:pyridoxamine 5'-phosphate oxidase family protein n=1 Tax=Paenibacillus sp. 1P07SE TaxID=3132209 RepID=UPI0039A75D30